MRLSFECLWLHSGGGQDPPGFKKGDQGLFHFSTSTGPMVTAVFSVSTVVPKWKLRALTGRHDHHPSQALYTVRLQWGRIARYPSHHQLHLTSVSPLSGRLHKRFSNKSARCSTTVLSYWHLSLNEDPLICTVYIQMIRRTKRSCFSMFSSAI